MNAIAERGIGGREWSRPPAQPAASSAFSRRALAVALVIVIHIAMGLVLLLSNVLIPTQHASDDLIVRVVPPDQEEKRPPPPVQPMPPTPYLTVLPPLQVIELQIPAVAAAVVAAPPSTATDPLSTSVHAADEKHESVFEPPRFVHAVDLRQYYPAAARRMHEEGEVVLKVCVKSDGRYEGYPAIVTSSGVPTLDEAGVRMVLDNKMRPGTMDGEPIRSCSSIAVEFKLAS